MFTQTTEQFQLRQRLDTIRTRQADNRQAINALTDALSHIENDAQTEERIYALINNRSDENAALEAEAAELLTKGA